jgi:hypothetical protein
MLTACGSYADGDQGSLESVVAEEISQQIEREAPMVEVRSVDCVRMDSNTDCAVQLGVGNIVLSLHYDVVFGDDRCWEATARDLRVDGASSQTNPVAEISRASNLKGCLA